MAITLVTTDEDFAAMIAGDIYMVSMDQVGITEHQTLYTCGFGPCMVLVVHHPALRAGGLAHLSAPFCRSGETQDTYVRDHVSQILNKIGANPSSTFDVALIEGVWGQSGLMLEELSTSFIKCSVVDRRARQYRLTSGVVAYDPGTGRVAHYNDPTDQADKKATPYAGALRAREMTSMYPVWQPDAAASRCNNPECRVEFGFWTRRHHCRRCGLIFCSDCSSKEKKVLYPASRSQKDLSASIGKLLRVCDGCAAA